MRWCFGPFLRTIICTHAYVVQINLCVHNVCSSASTASIRSGDEATTMLRSHSIVGRSGSVTINVRMSSSSTSSLSKDSSTVKPRVSVTSKASSEVPSITVDASSPDFTTQSTSSLCEILPDDSK